MFSRRTTNLEWNASFDSYRLSLPSYWIGEAETRSATDSAQTVGFDSAHPTVCAEIKKLLSQAHMKKTNAIRLLAQKQITHRLLPYTYDADHLDVSTIAQAMGLPVALLYKTLVAKGDKTGVIVALVPGDKQLDYKALAKISGNKKVALVQVKDLLKLTGYIRGGCSPLGMKKDYPVYLDQSAELHEEIYINAGQRGMMIGIAPAHLIKISNAIIASIC